MWAFWFIYDLWNLPKFVIEPSGRVQIVDKQG